MGWAERRNPRSEYNRKRGYKPPKYRDGTEPEVIFEFNVIKKLRAIYGKIHSAIN